MKRFLLRLLNKMDAQYQNTTHFSWKVLKRFTINFRIFFFKYVLQEKKDQVEISSTSNLPSNKKGEGKNILKLLWTGV